MEGIPPKYCHGIAVEKVKMQTLYQSVFPETHTPLVLYPFSVAGEKSAVGGSSSEGCHLRSTIPLRLERKPPCRPNLRPLHQQDCTALEMEPRPPSAPPAPPAPPCPQPGKVSTLDLPQGSTQSQVSMKSTSSHEHACVSCESANEGRERIPFNGVPALLAVLPTPHHHNIDTTQS